MSSVTADVGAAADRFRETRSAQASEIDAVDESIRHEPVRAAVVVRQDRLAAVLLTDLAKAVGDLLDRVVPGDPLEASSTLAASTTHGMKETVLVVDPLAETADLGADEAFGDGVVPARVNLLDDAVFHRDFERAGVGAIQNAGRREARRAHSSFSASSSA